MEIIRSLDHISPLASPPVVTLGNFDGVHRGHQEIFRLLRQKARQQGAPSVVITFVPHPLKLLAPAKAPLLISTYAERERLIAAAGIDLLVAIPFTTEFAQLSASDFVRLILVEGLAVASVMIGYDYAFGRNREGDGDFLRRAGQQFGFQVEVLPPLAADGVVYSSSRVRALIGAGNVRQAAELLGRHFSCLGTVVHGHHRGKGLGFPTANIETDQELLPAHGVYAVKLDLDGILLDGACNIGTNPTFGDQEQSVEVFLLDYSGELYGRRIRLYFIDQIREERTFASADELVVAISRDVERCREILSQTLLFLGDERGEA
jgi:riboflavin kinase/FMN adenylyltransferase